MPPNKAFHNVEQLSGGERTVAALALLFAIQSYRPSPFFILDEIDAALDKFNIQRVVRYLTTHKTDVQFLVVSHNNSFYENADSLVGVLLDGERQCSRTLTLRLSDYPEATRR
jgi:structural maintenance of chromosome 1